MDEAPNALAVGSPSQISVRIERPFACLEELVGPNDTSAPNTVRRFIVCSGSGGSLAPPHTRW